MIWQHQELRAGGSGLECKVMRPFRALGREVERKEGKGREVEREGGEGETG